MGNTNIDAHCFNHLSDISYHDGCMFCIAQDHTPDVLDEDRQSLLLCISDDLELVGFSRIPYGGENVYHHDAESVGWCAVNPWDKRLYTHTTDKFRLIILGYDVTAFYTLRQNRSNWGRYVDLRTSPKRVMHFFSPDHKTEILPSFTENSLVGAQTSWHQGATFSQNGRFYFSYSLPNELTFGGITGWINAIRVYDALSGIRLGEIRFDFDGNAPEIEGISLHPEGFFMSQFVKTT